MFESQRQPVAVQTLSVKAAAPAARVLVQRKLSVGSVNDPLENEADRVADRVILALRQPRASPVDGSGTDEDSGTPALPDGHRSLPAPAAVSRPVSTPGRISRAVAPTIFFRSAEHSEVLRRTTATAQTGVVTMHTAGESVQAPVDPLAVALGFKDASAARETMGPAHFDALKGVSLTTLSPVTQGSASVDMARNLAENQRDDSARIAAVLTTLKPLLGLGIAIALSYDEATYYLVHVDHIAAAQRALDASPGDLGAATRLMTFLQPWLADANHLGEVERVVKAHNNDFVAAGAEVRELERFQWDRALMEEAQAEATAGAERHVGQLKTTADNQFAADVGALGKRPVVDRNANPTAKAKQVKATVAYNSQVEIKDAAKSAAHTAADAEREPQRQSLFDASAGFINDPAITRQVGEAGARWIASLVKFDVAVGRALLPAFNGFGYPGGCDTARAICGQASSAAAVTSAVAALAAARSAGVSEEVALQVTLDYLALATSTKLTTADITWLAGDRAAHSPDSGATLQFLTDHRSSIARAMSALRATRAEGLPIAELVGQVSDPKLLDQVDWVLNNAKSAVKREVAFEMLLPGGAAGGKTSTISQLMQLPDADVRAVQKACMAKQCSVADVNVTLAANTLQYPVTTVAGWINKYHCRPVTAALVGTKTYKLEEFVEEFIGFSSFGDSAQAYQLILLLACLRAGQGGAVTETRPDVRYQSDDRKRTGFVHFDPPNHPRIIIHTHWNEEAMGGKPAYEIVSMHVQIGSENGTEVNKWKEFKTAQDAILRAHNACRASPQPPLTFKTPT